MSIRIGVIQFPGSNCERETMLAIERAGMVPVPHLWNAPTALLDEMQGFVIVGGFSYEDRSRAGVIAAHDPLMVALHAQSDQGKLILGICNGAQILVEAGLVPGVLHNQVVMALTDNKRIVDGNILGTGYYNAWIQMRLSDTYQRNAFTRHLTPENILSIPVAHAEGRFVMTQALLDEIKVQGLNVFQYCDAAGQVLPHFPVNPNGSIDNIAAISNKRGNVLAMMPHPERTQNGDPIFLSMRDAILEGRVPQATALYYAPRDSACPRYAAPSGSTECVVELKMTDNQAWTVQNTFKQMHAPLIVHRKTHWEIHCDDPTVIQQIKQSEVLYQNCKEKEWVASATPGEAAIAILVRAKEDLIGQKKLQTLQDHFGIQGVKTIKHSVVWFFSHATLSEKDLVDYILATHMISNPYAHDCYRYTVSSRARF
ncbi:MAG: phosphoribosylformylglycinamidine synthase I [Gammaproteobacteria bacterium RIFCSPHIGHO2_12_FULL_42_10]|nr:MAG: phosphoribosylformylglycinamidine synthase I [Gammaproteobacteria bacterium RIFCSPHIGHO2_12_FULL_42_10]